MHHIPTSCVALVCAVKTLRFTGLHSVFVGVLLAAFNRLVVGSIPTGRTRHKPLLPKQFLLTPGVPGAVSERRDLWNDSTDRPEEPAPWPRVVNPHPATS